MAIAYMKIKCGLYSSKHHTTFNLTHVVTFSDLKQNRVESISCNTCCYQGPHLKKRRILMTCIDLYNKQRILGIDFNTSPRRTCLLVRSDIVCAYQKHEATDEQREIKEHGVHGGIFNSVKAAGILHLNTSCMPDITNKGIHLVNISLKRINVILYKRCRISCFLPQLLKRSKICHGPYSKINHTRSQSVMRSET